MKPDLPHRVPADGWSVFDCCVVTASIAMLGIQVVFELNSSLCWFEKPFP
jgi:hypothetical protein